MMVKRTTMTTTRGHVDTSSTTSTSPMSSNTPQTRRWKPHRPSRSVHLNVTIDDDASPHVNGDAAPHLVEAPHHVVLDPSPHLDVAASPPRRRHCGHITHIIVDDGHTTQVVHNNNTGPHHPRRQQRWKPHRPSRSVHLDVTVDDDASPHVNVDAAPHLVEAPHHVVLDPSPHLDVAASPPC